MIRIKTFENYFNTDSFIKWWKKPQNKERDIIINDIRDISYELTDLGYNFVIGGHGVMDSDAYIWIDNEKYDEFTNEPDLSNEFDYNIISDTTNRIIDYLESKGYKTSLKKFSDYVGDGPEKRVIGYFIYFSKNIDKE